MSQVDVQAILRVFQTPSSSADAAERFGLPAAILEGLLKQLQARGMVTPVEPGVGACAPGCRSCSMQNFCPSSEAQSEKEPPLATLNPKVWRLTPLGEQSVRP